jgi:transposase
METKQQISSKDFAIFIGLDWGDQEHVYQICDTATQEIKEHTVKQDANALATWAENLQKRYPEQKIAIALEQSKGAVINFLMEYDFLVVYVVSPKLAATYRKAFKSSGAKDDGNDSGFILDILMRHRDKLCPWRPEDAQTKKLQILTEKRRNAVNERTRISNRLKAILKQYYPLALNVAGDTLYSVLACTFLLRWSSFGSLKRARTKTIRDFYTKHGCRNNKAIEKRLKLIQQAKPLTSDKVIIETSVMEVKMLVGLILVLIKHIESYDTAINSLFPTHPDADIFVSFPGAGEVLAPRLLSAFGRDRDRFAEALDLQNYGGIAPVTVQSGKHRLVRWRWACPKFLRQSFHEFAGESRKHSIWASAYYDKKRSEGKSHNSAVRSLAYKWIRIIFRCWKDHKAYDELRYIQTLKSHGSDLFAYMVQV